MLSNCEVNMLLGMGKNALGLAILLLLGNRNSTIGNPWDAWAILLQSNIEPYYCDNIAFQKSINRSKKWLYIIYFMILSVTTSIIILITSKKSIRTVKIWDFSKKLGRKLKHDERTNGFPLSIIFATILAS